MTDTATLHGVHTPADPGTEVEFRVYDEAQMAAGDCDRDATLFEEGNEPGSGTPVGRVPVTEESPDTVTAEARL